MTRSQPPTSGGVILLAEDDPDITNILDAYLRRDGFRTIRAADGSVARQKFYRDRPDLILLDLNLPKLDGFDVLRSVRQSDFTPVIVVSARTTDFDKLDALGLGADDYVTKPFNPNEVVARVHAVLRRSKTEQVNSVIRYGEVCVIVNDYLAWVERHEQRIDLRFTPVEFRLLAYMLASPQRVFTRQEVMDACAPESDALERTVDSHISKIRRKLRAAGVDGWLTMVRGVGYRLAPMAH